VAANHHVWGRLANYYVLPSHHPSIEEGRKEGKGGMREREELLPIP